MSVSRVRPRTDLAKALSHPLRQRVLVIYAQRAASPGEIAELLGEPLGNVAYHTRRLVDLGCVELVEEVRGRGSLKHRYRATVRIEFDAAAWGELPRSLRGSLVARAIEQIAGTIGAGAACGGLDADAAHVVRRELDLDDRGRSELSSLLIRAIEPADEIAEASAGRSAGRPRSALAIMHFRVA